VAIEKRDVVALGGRHLAVSNAAGDLFESLAHLGDLARRRQRRDLAHGDERASDVESAGTPQVPPPPQIEVAPSEGFAVEPVVEHEVDRHAHDSGRGQAIVFLQHEGRLQVVVERNDERTVRREIARRAVAVEVNQDAVDRVAMLDDAGVSNRVGNRVLVRVGAGQGFLPELAGPDGAGEYVG
jgi:hypothetical protein